MIWHPQMPKGSKTESDKKGLAPLAIAAGNKRFDDPIPLPRGRQLVTLEDSGKLHHETAESRA
jgi:hypothetical protein